MLLLPQFAESLIGRPKWILENDYPSMPRYYYEARREMSQEEYYNEVMNTSISMFGEDLSINKTYFDALKKVGMQLYGDKRGISDYL